MNQFYKNLALWLIISMVGFLLFTQLKKTPEDLTFVRYNDFLHMLDEGQVATTVVVNNNTISWYTSENKKFQTVVPPQNETMGLLLKKGINEVLIHKEDRHEAATKYDEIFFPLSKFHMSN